MAGERFGINVSRLVESAQSMLGYPAEHEKSLTKNLRIKSLFVHPIKSCRGSAVTEAHFDDGGLRFDRTWLIIDATTRKFQTARDLPKMGKGTVTVKTPLEPSKDELEKMEVVQDILIWVHKVDGYAVSTEADDALSQFFGKAVRLVRKGPTVRPSGPDDPRGDQSAMHYQDFYPFLVASSASLQHVRDTLFASVYPSMWDDNSSQSGAADVTAYKVSERVQREYWTPEQLETLGIERFRPNVLVESFHGQGDKEHDSALEPWEEDGWTHIEVFDGRAAAAAGDEPDGGVAWGKDAAGKGTGIDCVIRCGRCMVPNIDPDEGTRDLLLPYTVLQKFRQVQPELKPSGKPCFGMLSAPSQKSGVLRVGDIVRVTATTDPSKRTMTK